ncbi:hypothetical protein [Paracidovorax anthurii]|uniref:Protein FliT n=1 Tax=Paracidovorax anthurii TaxID=78229 RepID=A0A328Z3L2_9BURK|nr:hypothetical protein [Paracidovorax anthurii]RAR76846.1 hypothetical protein AX018_104228 [Paracidovorax anthurii]
MDIASHAPRQAALHEIAEQLLRASQAGAWQELQQADARLSALRAGGAWRDGERAALEAVRQAHAQALQHCRQAAAEAQARLGELAEQRDGWVAYAADQDVWKEFTA